VRAGPALVFADELADPLGSGGGGSMRVGSASVLVLVPALAAFACGGGESTTATPATSAVLVNGGAAGAGGAHATGAGGMRGSTGGGGLGAGGVAGAGGAGTGALGGAGGGVSAACTGKAAASGSSLLSLTSGGVLRTAIVHVPKSYDPAKPTMLVLNFHGFSSDAPQEALLTKMSDAADARGFLVVYPYGLFASWNAGQCCGDAWTNSVDDVGFVRDLVTRLEADYCVDARRVYAAGMSNGGFISHRLGCALSDVFAAIAPVAGALGIPAADCQPKRPVPVMHFHGTGDPLVPYYGGMPLTKWASGGMLDFPSVNQTLAVWRALDGCGDAYDVSYQKGDATCLRWSQCNGGAEVIRCTIDGGGHTWPGGMDVPFLGKTSHDLDATNAMLDFFDAHPMP
jgi:polyhydroxybutyrate depolymerase